MEPSIGDGSKPLPAFFGKNMLLGQGWKSTRDRTGRIFWRAAVYLTQIPKKQVPIFGIPLKKSHRAGWRLT